MWFKNLTLYRLTEPFSQSAEAVNEALEARRFKPCDALQQNTLGWVAPADGTEGLLAHAANGFIMLCAQEEQKLIPASLVKEQWQERIAAEEAETGRPLRRSERMTLRDNLMLELLPVALARRSRLYAYLDPGDGWLVIDSGSMKRAEALISLLRESLGTLPVVLPEA